MPKTNGKPKGKKVKLQISVSEEVNEKLLEYAEKAGITKSALCNMMMVQGILGMDKAMQILDEQLNKVSKEESERPVEEQ